MPFAPFIGRRIARQETRDQLLLKEIIEVQTAAPTGKRERDGLSAARAYRRDVRAMQGFTIGGAIALIGGDGSCANRTLTAGALCGAGCKDRSPDT